jgi:hypothetical protein
MCKKCHGSVVGRRCLPAKVVQWHAIRCLCHRCAWCSWWTRYRGMCSSKSCGLIFRILWKSSQILSYFITYHVPSEFNMLEKHSGDILGADKGRWMRYLRCVYLFCGVDRRKNGLLDLRDRAATILRVACKKLLHLLLLLSFLAFLERLADFFRHVVKWGHDDVLLADLGSSHGVECLDLDLTRDSPQRSCQKVCWHRKFCRLHEHVRVYLKQGLGPLL